MVEYNKAVGINDFSQEVECVFDGERYSVRDNGAVFRHLREGKRKRSNDNIWTFGRVNANHPYLTISTVRIHRIVAVAFHGDPPDSKYVVDHIDSNCRNNRPENLRWLSRLENTLKNPATRKKIEYLCGSIEAFLEKPSMLNDLSIEPEFKWMRTVTKEEAQNCLIRMSLWASEKTTYSDNTKKTLNKNSFNSRVFKPLQKWEAGLKGEPGLDFARTRWCAQYMWTPDVNFPCCPQNLEDDPLSQYYKNIIPGTLFAYNIDETFPRLTVIKSEIVKNKSSIVVMCDRADGYFSIVGITLNTKSHFIHFYLGSFYRRVDADYAFTQKKELEDFWSDGYGKSWDPK